LFRSLDTFEDFGVTPFRVAESWVFCPLLTVSVEGEVEAAVNGASVLRQVGSQCGAAGEERAEVKRAAEALIAQGEGAL
jgi:hypothetical protein